MNTVQMMTAQQWGHYLRLGLALAVTIVVLVAVALPAGAMLLTIALVVLGVSLATQRAWAAAQSARAPRAGAANADEAAPTMLLELADGALLSARPVPLSSQSKHTLALTREGYLLLNPKGEVVHKL
jgi:hypothetical protein